LEPIFLIGKLSFLLPHTEVIWEPSFDSRFNCIREKKKQLKCLS
jgi:hypothetical protein